MSTPILERFADDGTFPNTQLPTLIYKGAIDAPSPEAMEKLFGENGWPPQWRSGIYPFHHYHSTAHECLGVARGSARIMLGGPQGREFDIEAGDVLVLPAGTVHRRLSDSGDFLVVGAYPPGQDWDLLKGEPGDRVKALQNIPNVSLPKSDPVEGRDGVLVRAWNQESRSSVS
jgi:uncharacterized protein YjlB